MSQYARYPAGESAVVLGPLPAGSNIIGKVGIDQTTPGTTNGVVVNGFPIDQTVTGTITSTQNVVILSGGGYACIGFQVTGTWTGTIVVEASIDGTTWNSQTALFTTGGLIATQFSANNAGVIQGSGFYGVRLRGNSIGSGTASVFLRESATTGTISLGEPLPNGGNYIGNITTLGTVTNTVPIAGTGTAGTPGIAVLAIQGVAGGTAVPISGSITATNAAVGVTGNTAPTSASLSGGITAGNLKGISVDTSGNTVVVGAGTAGSASGGVLTVQGSASGTALPVSGTLTAVTTVSTVSTVTAVTAITNALPAGSNSIGTVVLGVGAAAVGSVTVTGIPTTDQVATTVATNQDGAIAAASLTTSYATVLTAGGTLVNVSMRNNTNGIVLISLNSGSTTAYTLDPGDAVSLDLKSLGRNVASGATLQAKYSGTAPTTGNIRINAVY